MNEAKPLIVLQRQIYREARAAHGPLEQVLPWLLDPHNLRAAWQRVAEAEGAKTPGADGLTVADVRGYRDRWLEKLLMRLQEGTYRPSPPRWVEVPKGPGRSGTRRLGILNLEDRVVQSALKQVLEPVLEPNFAPGSFGFRPGRQVAGALDEAVRRLSAGDGRAARYPYLCKLDVAECFDTIDHQLLLQRLSQRVADPKVLDLLVGVLAAGGRRSGWLWPRAVGLVQGGSLSPLLCNFSLDPLDQGLAALARRSDGGVHLLRYADDVLLLVRDRRLARRAVRLATGQLRQLRQRWKRSKSLIVPAKQGVRWLGVDIRPRSDCWSQRERFTYFVPAAKVEEMLARIDDMTTPPSLHIDPTAFDLGRWFVSINVQLKDWWQAYVYAENAAAVFRTLDERAQERVRELLRAVTGARGKQLDAHRARLPRGFQTWQVNGVRLAVLSALAPRCPSYLTRRPVWMHSRPKNGQPTTV